MFSHIEKTLFFMISADYTSYFLIDTEFQQIHSYVHNCNIYMYEYTSSLNTKSCLILSKMKAKEQGLAYCEINHFC